MRCVICGKPTARLKICKKCLERERRQDRMIQMFHKTKSRRGIKFDPRFEHGGAQ